MKKILSIFVVPLLFMGFMSIHIIADDDTLDLNTDELENKQDNYSSLTDINGINIFTNDVEKVIKEQNKATAQENKKMRNDIFTKNFKVTSQTSNASGKNLFQKPITFDNTQVTSTTTINITPIIIVITIVAGGVVFISTRKYYKKRELMNCENNSDIYS